LVIIVLGMGEEHEQMKNTQKRDEKKNGKQRM
jgi:hypothetical protein